MEPQLPDQDPEADEAEAPAAEQSPARPRRKRNAAASSEGTMPPSAERILEAMLFAGRGPVTFEKARQILTSLEAKDFLTMIDALNAAYRTQGRPYALMPRDQGYVMTIKPSHLPLLERLRGPARETRLSSAAIDVLSLVAYRQPIAKGDIDAIRGFDSGAILRQLLKHGLLSTERKAESGRDLIYSTTSRFLTLFNLQSLDDLPQTQELERL
jgi:segregation and condensation protein B